MEKRRRIVCTSLSLVPRTSQYRQAKINRIKQDVQRLNTWFNLISRFGPTAKLRLSISQLFARTSYHNHAFTVRHKSSTMFLSIRTIVQANLFLAHFKHHEAFLSFKRFRIVDSLLKLGINFMSQQLIRSAGHYSELTTLVTSASRHFFSLLGYHSIKKCKRQNFQV